MQKAISVTCFLVLLVQVVLASTTNKDDADSTTFVKLHDDHDESWACAGSECRIDVHIKGPPKFHVGEVLQVGWRVPLTGKGKMLRVLLVNDKVEDVLNAPVVIAGAVPEYIDKVSWVIPTYLHTAFGYKVKVCIEEEEKVFDKEEGENYKIRPMLCGISDSFLIKNSRKNSDKHFVITHPTGKKPITAGSIVLIQWDFPPRFLSVLKEVKGMEHRPVYLFIRLFGLKSDGSEKRGFQFIGDIAKVKVTDKFFIWKVPAELVELKQLFFISLSVVVGEKSTIPVPEVCNDFGANSKVFEICKAEEGGTEMPEELSTVDLSSKTRSRSNTRSSRSSGGTIKRAGSPIKYAPLVDTMPEGGGEHKDTNSGNDNAQATKGESSSAASWKKVAGIGAILAILGSAAASYFAII